MIRCLSLCLAASLAACAAEVPPTVADFARHEAMLLQIGKMRSDTRPADVPFSNDELAENFRRIAFYEKPDDRTAISRRLTRWVGPIRYSLIGESTTNAEDAELHDLMARIGRLTGLHAQAEREDPNFMILILTPQEHQRFARLLDARHGSGARNAFEEIAAFGWDCSVHAFGSAEAPNLITSAVVYIRAEVTGHYRRACLHEEVTQGLGLFNDDSRVRPSVFNDDEEFALMTEHDEYLVRVLYDPRLSPGMTAGAAMPTVRRIIAELRPG